MRDRGRAAREVVGEDGVEEGVEDGEGDVGVINV